MKKNKERNRLLGFLCCDEFRAVLWDYAVRKGWSLSTLMRRALEHYMKNFPVEAVD